MRISNYLVSAIMFIAMMACVSSAAVVGRSTIRAPAVIVYNNTGSLTTITLAITNGDGGVNFTNATSVANSTLGSGLIAARYGAYYSSRNFSRYNFTYSVYDGGSNVSGPSAGAAMTLLVISAFESKPLRSDLTITGTINPDGTIGQIGGAIDKVAAASTAGLRFVLVPRVTPGSIEEGAYFIAQTEYHLPLIEVSNVSQAAGYEFGNLDGAGKGIMVNFSNNYTVGNLTQAELNCSNSCDEMPFASLANYTINLTRSEILNLSALPGFGGAAGQLINDTYQADMIHQAGYYYTSADIAFLSYLDAFYLSSYNMSRIGALDYMQNVQMDCSGLMAPQLTFGNYEYVIGAELRQGWANYTINSTLTGYNVSGATEDDIVYSMYSTGQAQAWCGAASTLYDYPYQGSGAPATFSLTLAQTAVQRINRAGPYPGMYLTLAQEAYRQGNYPVAIIDADYAYALTTAGQRFTEKAPQLINESAALASNSTYGAWATEFAKEATFYAYESASAKNSTLAQFYAEQAYTSAYLASQVSNDTQIIYHSLVPAPKASTSAGPSFNDTAIVSALKSLTAQVYELTVIVAITLALLVGCMALVAILVHKLMVASARQGRRGRKGK